MNRVLEADPSNRVDAPGGEMRKVCAKWLVAAGVVAAFAYGGAGLLLRAEPPQPIGSWARTATIADSRTGAATAALDDNRSVVIGGLRADGTPTASVDLYDAAANSFTPLGHLLDPRHGHTATLLKDGTVAITGGRIDSLLSADVEVFDLSSGSSVLAASMSQPRTDHAATRLPNGTVLIVGGTTANGVILDSAETYEPLSGAVTPVAGRLSTPRTGASATTLIDGRVLIAGGSDGSNDLSSAEIFDPAFQSFSAVDTPLSVARSGHTAVLLPNNGGVLLSGGSADGVAQQAADLFLPAEFPDPYSYGMGYFVPTLPMTAARSRAVAGPTPVEGYAFAMGGGSADAEVYRFATIKTDKDDYAPGELAVITGSGWEPGEEVRLLFQEDPAVHEDYVLRVTADAEGNIFWNQWAPEAHDEYVRFYLLATDSKSRAQITFTDAPVLNSVNLQSGSQSVTCLTSGAACSPANLTVTSGATIGADLTGTGENVPGGGSVQPNRWSGARWLVASSFNSSALSGCQDISPNVNNSTTTRFFNITAPSAPGMYNAYFVGYSDDLCQANASATFIAPNAIVVDGTGPSDATVVTPANGGSFSAATIPAFSGTAADSIGGAGLNANSTTFTLRRPDSTYWNGSTWQAVLSARPTTHVATISNGTANWTASGAMPVWASEPIGTYTVQATAVDKAGNIFTGGATTFTFTAANQAPTDISLSNSSVAENQASGTTVGTFSTTDPNGGDTHTYSLVSGTGGADNASFSIVGSTLQTAATFNFETKSSYSIRVRTTETGSAALTFEKAFTITVLDMNEAPTALVLSNLTVAENQAPGASVGSFTTTDPDFGQTFTYSLVAGAGDTDNAAFSVVGDGLNTAASFDFETKSSYSIRVRTTDSGTPAEYLEEIFTISILDVNETPTDIALTNASVAENQPSGTSVGTFSTTDPDTGQTFTYTLVPGAGDTDNAAFSVVGDGLQTAASFDFETKSSYSIRVRTTDSGTPAEHLEEIFTITVLDVNETPTDIALSDASVAENQPTGTSVGTFSTTDPDTGQTFTYTLVPGAGDTDNAAFSIVSDGLQTAASFDFETKSSYSIRVRTTDSGTPAAHLEEIFTISILDVNETPTDIALTNASVAENQSSGTSVGTFSTTDPDTGQTFTYTLVPGAGDTDNAAFAIVGDGLQTADSFDFETKSSYSIRVRTTDSGTPAAHLEEIFTISILDVNETPTDIALTNASVAENQPSGTSVGTFSTTDPDTGQTFTYTLVAGAGSTDNASFAIAGTALQTAASFDFETKSSYSIRVRTTDSGTPAEHFEEVFTISVTNVNEAPVLAALTNQNILLGNSATFTATATDPDAGTTLVFSLTGTIPAGAAIDATGHFSWTPTAAQVGSHTFNVRVSDGVLSDSKPITINVAYTFVGFFAPIANAPVMNVVNAGRAIPVKWELQDTLGHYILDLNTVSSITYYQIACASETLDNLISGTADTTGASGLRLSGNGYAFNWQTEKNFANKCFEVRTMLNDGGVRAARFKFSK
jgi:hypothetical protein